MIKRKSQKQSFVTPSPVLQKQPSLLGSQSRALYFCQQFRTAVRRETECQRLTPNAAYKVVVHLGFSDNLQTTKRLIIKLVETAVTNNKIEVSRLESLLLQVQKLKPYDGLSTSFMLSMYPLVLNR